MLPLGGTAHGTRPLTIGLPSREAGGQEDSGRSCKPKVEVEKPCRSRRGWQVEMAQRDWPHTEGDQAAARETAPCMCPSFHALTQLALCANFLLLPETLYRRSVLIPILQLGKRRHGEVKHLTQGFLLVSGEAEIQTLTTQLWFPGVLTTILPAPPWLPSGSFRSGQ